MAEHPRAVTIAQKVGLVTPSGATVTQQVTGTGSATITTNVGTGSPTPIVWDAKALAALGTPAVVEASGTSIALTAAHSDLGGRRYTDCTAATAVTITIPAYATTPIPVGSMCVFRWAGDGQPAFAAAEGVTFDPATALKIGAKYKLAGVIHKSENVWAPVGCLVA